MCSAEWLSSLAECDRVGLYRRAGPLSTGPVGFVLSARRRFHLEQLPLQLGSLGCGEPPESSRGGNDAVAGNQDRDGVVGHRAAHSPGGTRLSDLSGDLAVAGRSAVTDLADVLHHQESKTGQGWEGQLDVVEVGRLSRRKILKTRSQLRIPVRFSGRSGPDSPSDRGCRGVANLDTVDRLSVTEQPEPA